MKLGAEYLYAKVSDFRCVPCQGLYDATVGPIPANIESIFPDVLNADTWNLAALSSITRSVQGIFGKPDTLIPRYTSGVWVQDDWTVTPRLTLNLGLRYDVELNAFANDVELLPWMPGNRATDTNNLAPRLGSSFSLNDRTVIRGGFGLYFGTFYNPHLMKYATQALRFTVFNDDRPDFASNPFQGVTFESVLAKLCTPALEPGCLRRDAVIYPEKFEMPLSYQSSIGIQRQLGTTMAIEADYVYIVTRKAPITTPPDNVNLTYNPATGANYPFSDLSRRPFPHWGIVTLTRPGQRFNSHALQTAFTKRMSDGWQASATYTLAGLWDAVQRPIQWTGSGFEEVPFATAPDLGGDYSLAVSDQRHRAVINGIWQLRYGFQLSGLYFFGSGERYPTSWGVNLRGGAGNNAGERRLRPNGTYVERNNLVGKPIHRVDLRLQRRFPLGGRAGIDGILELFNVFNHANYGRYVTQEVSRLYGQPQQNPLVAYLPRMLQLGFRFAF
jgi:hypothetical protein